MFKYREFIAQIKYKEVISSPVYFIPVLLLSIMIIIEGFHIFNHKQNCKTKAEWMDRSKIWLKTYFMDWDYLTNYLSFYAYSS